MMTNTKALLLVAHGSRRAQSNDEVAVLAAHMQTHYQTDFSIIKAAFLELASPSIPEGIAACVADGAQSVTVLPYFLNTGRHVAEDIPREVATAQAALPDIEITVLKHIGALPAMQDLLLEAVK